MTVSTQSNRNRTDGNDVTTEFAYNFKIFQAADLLVTLYDANGVGTAQTITTHYTVDTITETGGQITMVTPPATGEVLARERDLAYTQSVDYAEQDPFPAEIQETALDRLTMLVQQVKDISDLAIKVTGAGDEDPSYEIEPPVAGEIVVGDATATGWEHKTLAELGSGSVALPLSVANGGTNSATAAGARTNLGLGSVAVEDTGTGAGEVPKNSDLGSSSVEDAGTGASEMVQLNSSARLPAVSGRNLTDVAARVLLVDQDVAVAASTVDTYSFTTLDAYDNYYLELLGVGLDHADLHRLDADLFELLLLRGLGPKRAPEDVAPQLLAHLAIGLALLRERVDELEAQHALRSRVELVEHVAHVALVRCELRR